MRSYPDQEVIRAACRYRGGKRQSPASAQLNSFIEPAPSTTSIRSSQRSSPRLRAVRRGGLAAAVLGRGNSTTPSAAWTPMR